MFEDEFEEFRARSYSGGFCPRRRRKSDNRPRIPDQPTGRSLETPTPTTADDLPSYSAFSSSDISSADAVPQSAPVHWGYALDPMGACLMAHPPRRSSSLRPPTTGDSNGTSTRVVEVVVRRRRREDPEDDWEMRPRLNSAPLRRTIYTTHHHQLHQHHQRHHVTMTTTKGLEILEDRNSLDPIFANPIRKIRSFIVLGKKCFHHGDEDEEDSEDLDSDVYSGSGWGNRRRGNWSSEAKSSEEFPPGVGGRKTMVGGGHLAMVSVDVTRPEECYRVLFSGRQGVGKATIVKRLLNTGGNNSNRSMHQQCLG